MSLRKVLYTAGASTDGGREGVVRSSDGRLKVSLSVPVELRVPTVTTPTQSRLAA